MIRKIKKILDDWFMETVEFNIETYYIKTNNYTIFVIFLFLLLIISMIKYII